MSAEPPPSPQSRRALVWAARLGLVALALVLAVAVAGYTVATVFPDIGAQYSDVLRGIIGDAAVAQLESIVYQVQDTVYQWSFHLGIARATSPWAATPLAAAPATAPLPSITADARAATTSPVTSAAPAATAAASPSANPLPVNTNIPPIATAPVAAVATGWVPGPLTTLGSLPGEGQWTPFLRNPAGRVLAYRSFLQPDSSRPYAVVAIVAIDLSATRLHFVLGTDEPTSTLPILRTGRVHTNDLVAGYLLAAFNGGFKARHGHFGAMASGITAISPRAGLATVAMYSSGVTRIGAWGTDITTTPGISSVRQNGPLLIHDGQLNPHTADKSIDDWGASLTGESAVWRSGLGISADGKTLYYLAGPSLTLPALANAMVATGAAQAMQLDINNYWVHFETFHWPADPPGGKPTAVPLLDSMQRGTGRYLGAWSRDFFYITADGG